MITRPLMGAFRVQVVTSSAAVHVKDTNIHLLLLFIFLNSLFMNVIGASHKMDISLMLMRRLLKVTHHCI